jgi:hypothetical protein
LNLIEGDVLDILFTNNFFQLVFTIGVLLAIPLEHVEMAIDEIVCCSNRYVWGLEFYTDEYDKIEHSNLYWEADLINLYQ